MIRILSFWRAARVAAVLVVLVSVFGTSPALAARDRTPPTRPTNLRATSVTSYQVQLAWNASTDNSGSLSYRVVVSDGGTYTVPQTQTTFTAFVAPIGTYSFYVYAVDGSGNRSLRSNTVSVTPPPDTTAPTPPVVSVVGVNPTEVSLAWTASTDDGPYLFYQVFVNGSPSVDARQNRFAVVQGLTPETTYEFTVKARDLYGPPNVSAPSNVVTVTTSAVGGVDTEPPSAPGNLHGWDTGDGAREINLFWTQSVDNQTPQASIVYEVYMNGVLDHTTGGGRTILYATQAGANTFTVIAVDEAGNKSEPA
ncbi:fibronectin type III domain-containing protein, partial [bacterium]